MRYGTFFVRAFLIPTLFFMAMVSCRGSETPLYTDKIVKTEYPKLADAIVNRDFISLLGFTEHEDKRVSEMAWRALAKSETDSLDAFVQKVKGHNSRSGWFALSFHPLEEEHLSAIALLFETGSATPQHLCEVFYRQGGSFELNLLLSQEKTVTENSMCALAVSGIMTRDALPEESIREVIEIAFGTDDPVIRRNLLYGFYRSQLNRPRADSENYNLMSRLWAESGVGEMDETDQYMVRILEQRGLNVLMNRLDDSHLKNRTELSVELARVLQFSELSLLDRDQVKRILRHPNPNVVTEALESLTRNPGTDPEWIEWVAAHITGPTRSDEKFIASLELLQANGVDTEPYISKLDFTDHRNPYLANRTLELWKSLEPGERYFERIMAGIEEGGIRAMHSIRTLADRWSEEQNPVEQAQIRSVVRKAVDEGERSVIAGMGILLGDENITADEDFDWLKASYNRFQDAGDRGSASVLEGVLEDRFADRFEAREEAERFYRIPDWERLYELGTRPYWVLETNKGTIEIRLDPLSAPFTVSSIDSLTHAGLYDDVVFHRVVRNFVIQGGDFDRRDGFGSPDYTLPTESSLDSFERGKAGIASSGTDTEGSQYFMMHQWAPHLDGNYTIFGEVTRGMDAADRIQIGDRVTRATISIR